MNKHDDTIVAIATPLGRGALGIVRLSGSQAFETADSICRLKNRQKIASLSSHTIHLGYITKLEHDDEYIDEVLVSIMKGPQTYTGENVVEFSCHNNPIILESIVACSTGAGARIAMPGEFTQRAFLNGRMDLSQAEAVAMLIASESRYGEHAALKQLLGSISKTVHSLREVLIGLLAHTDVCLDHEDIMPPDITHIKKKIDFVLGEITQYLSRSRDAASLCQGLTIVITGKPNVGKSSLFNALVQKEKAIVSMLPGTTRDPIEAKFEYQGIMITIVDTAGIHNNGVAEFSNEITTHNEIECSGMAKSKSHIEEADYVFFVMDINENIDEHDKALAEHLKKQNKNVVIAANKCDKENKWDLGNKVVQNLFDSRVGVISVSAVTGEGIVELLDVCMQHAKKDEIYSRSDHIITSTRQKALLEKARENLVQAKELCDKAQPLEIISFRIREALQNLGEIVGIGVSDEVLDKIFSSFCVGK